MLGDHMRAAAAGLELKTGVPSILSDRLSGLEACDRFVKALADLSRRPVPSKIRRQRESLVDAMLDGHFFFGRKRVAVALEPEQLHAYAAFLHDMGCEVVAAVSPTQAEKKVMSIAAQDNRIGCETCAKVCGKSCCTHEALAA